MRGSQAQYELRIGFGFATFEFLYEFPGWPRTIRGRAELMTAYSGYGNSIRLGSADKFVVYHAGNGRVVIIECSRKG